MQNIPQIYDIAKTLYNKLIKYTDKMYEFIGEEYNVSKEDLFIELDHFVQAILFRVALADDRLLVACHIKPYSECDEEEKYDSKNGIIMTPTYHTLFDLGFISFENDGTLLISPFISNITKKRLNLKDGMPIRLQTGSDKYLEYHRENIFNKLPDII